MDQTRILVAEDYGPLRQMIEALLGDEGYLVQAAADGVEALAAVEAAKPDLIVSDIMMPRMDGYALFAAVRARRDWTAIPFIFLTAKAEKHDMLRGKELGAEDYVTKPFDPDELLVAVRARLGRARTLQAAVEAEFDLLKEQLVRTLSHELRTPLTSILGFTELALEGTPEMSAGSLQEFLAAIQWGAVHLWRLTDDLLLLVRLDTGQAAKEFSQMARPCSNLAATVEDVVGRFRSQATGCGVTLAVRATPLPAAVSLHGVFFADALGRLLDNAIKFSPAGQARPVTVDVRPVQDGIEVAVSDRGCGIAADAMPHLFERFRQIDRGKMEQQGSGVGLAIAQGLIRLHGGDIYAESKPGRGSVFTIRLPATEVSPV